MSCLGTVCTPATPAFRMPGQERGEPGASLGYIAKPLLLFLSFLFSSPLLLLFFFKAGGRVGEMAQKLRACVALVENPCTATHNFLQLQLLETQHPFLVSVGTCTHVACTQRHLHIHINKNKSFNKKVPFISYLNRFHLEN